MSDRPARPEWRAAYLDRTLPRRSPRSGTRPAARRATDDALVTSQRGAAIAGDTPTRSLPLSIAAMLHLVPTA
jgi:hypothetical protein